MLDAKNQEDIESFMQNSLLVIDNYQDLQMIMLEILAKLSIVKQLNFGISCFNTLKELMMSGADMKQKVTQVILLEIINKMNQKDPTMIPLNLLMGLCMLIDEVDNPNMLSTMYDTCFPLWIRQFCDKYLQSGDKIMKDHCHYDEVIHMIAISVRSPHNIELFLEKHLLPLIIKIMYLSDRTNRRYISVLEIVTSLSKQNAKVADLIMQMDMRALIDRQQVLGDFQKEKVREVHHILVQRI